MKLAIVFDDGDLEIVAEDIEDYNFHASGHRWAVITAIQRTVNRITAFRAASPKSESET